MTVLSNDTQIHYIQQGTTNPPIEATIVDVNGVAIDITGMPVKFQAVRVGESTLAIDADATIVNASQGKVRYGFSSPDTATAGLLSAWWLVNGEAFPNAEPYIAVAVVARLAEAISTSVTVAMLRDYLPQLPPSPAIDTVLGRILTRVERQVEDAIGAHYGAYTSASARFVRSYGGEFLTLPPHNPGSVSAVVVSGVTLDPTWYMATSGNRLVAAPLASGGWAGSLGAWGAPGHWGAAYYRVTAQWGPGPMPPSIAQLVLELAVNAWRAKDKGLFTEIIGSDSAGLRYIGGLNKQQQATIENERARLGLDEVVV